MHHKTLDQSKKEVNNLISVDISIYFLNHYQDTIIHYYIYFADL